MLIFQGSNFKATNQVQIIDHYAEQIKAIYFSVKQEEYEVLEVVKVNAVDYPRTVVVHFQDAHVAGSTVMSSIRLNNPASLAISH